MDHFEEGKFRIGLNKLVCQTAERQVTKSIRSKETCKFVQILRHSFKGTRAANQIENGNDIDIKPSNFTTQEGELWDDLFDLIVQVWQSENKVTFEKSLGTQILKKVRLGIMNKIGLDEGERVTEEDA